MVQSQKQLEAKAIFAKLITKRSNIHNANKSQCIELVRVTSRKSAERLLRTIPDKARRVFTFLLVLLTLIFTMNTEFGLCHMYIILVPKQG